MKNETVKYRGSVEGVWNFKPVVAAVIGTVDYWWDAEAIRYEVSLDTVEVLSVEYAEDDGEIEITKDLENAVEGWVGIGSGIEWGPA